MFGGFRLQIQKAFLFIKNEALESFVQPATLSEQSLCIVILLMFSMFHLKNLQKIFNVSSPNIK